MTDNLWRVCVSLTLVKVEVKSGFKNSIIAHSVGCALALEVPKNSITPSLTWIAHGPSPDVATYSGYVINGYYYHTKRRDDIRRVQNSGCDWVDNRSGVKMDELGFTIVDLKRIGHKSDSIILATQAKQVFYVQDSANHEWMPNVDTPNETDDTTSTYIRHDCEGRWMSFDLQPNAKHSILMSASRKFRTFKTTLTQKYILPSKDQPSHLQFPPKIYSHINQEAWESFVDAKLSEEWEDYSRIQRERRSKCVYNHHMSRKGYANLAGELHELVATHKNEDILTDALGSKEHGGRKRMTQDAKSDKKKSNHSRSFIGSINIDLDVDEDLVNTPSNKGVEETPCQLSIGSINNIVAVATIMEDNIGRPNVKVPVDVVTRENLTIPNPVKGKIETLNQALVNIIE
ncbi:hypothetical protein E5676_scaffold165G00080 [Cucumis melo var. makuwa]|uniref:DUF4216 domain-containing protein n=1 Tax=Cucumis melo var. makuwa TaxID=1194695 RepID=A0A5D3DZI0_CUCMM|nr:hypothetical protein E5676_scaffold165G00080 [Cucumis melo var. makuwa]